jgi:site-specific DNA-adenine methylase
MFSYYGSKTKIIKKYPKPEKNLIIEPFAGSARYAIEYYYKDVILIDKYDKVCGVWEYLISATREEILKLPEVLPSQEISSVEGFNNLCQEAKWLLGFCCNRGSVSPKNYAGKFCSWDKDKIRIAGLVDKIKHWKVFNCDYRYVSNHDATWFVDPPYQKMGFLYKENKIDYKDLSMWCK